MYRKEIAVALLERDSDLLRNTDLQYIYTFLLDLESLLDKMDIL